MRAASRAPTVAARCGGTAVGVALLVAFPLYWMVLSALQAGGRDPVADPRPWTLHPTSDTFRRVLEQQDFGRYFLNSLLVAVTVVVAVGA